MRLTKIIIGELVVVVASVFIFRSLWTLMDEYFGYSYLLVFLVAGLVLAVLGLLILNNEVKCEIEKNKDAQSSRLTLKVPAVNESFTGAGIFLLSITPKRLSQMALRPRGGHIQPRLQRPRYSGFFLFQISEFATAFFAVEPLSFAHGFKPFPAVRAYWIFYTDGLR